MRQTATQSDHTVIVASSPMLSPVLGVSLCVLFLSLLAASVYVAPEQTIQAMAGIGIGFPLLALVWLRPELGVLAVVFLTCNFVPRDLISIRLLGGGLDIRDLMFLAMLAEGAIQRLLAKKFVIPWWPVSGPMFIFMGCGLFSLLYALLIQHVELNWAFSEFRPLMYYLSFFVIAWLILRPKQAIILLVGLFLLADFTSSIILLQQFAGKANALLAAMSSSTWYVRQTDPSAGFGTVRIVPPGHVLTFVMSIVAFGFMFFRGQSRWRRAAFGFQFVYLNIGLLFTYTRAQWVASTIALTLLTIVLPRSDKFHLARGLLIVLLVGSFIYGLFGEQIQAAAADTPFISALTDRMLSIFTPDQTLETDSLEWRVLETKEAYRSATQHPIIGVGLGNFYREPFLLQGEASKLGSRGTRFTRFVHNSYLYLAVKTGLTGLATFVCFALAFLSSGWLVYRRMVDERYKRLTLALLASFLGFLIWSGSQSHLLQVESTVVAGLVIGLVVSLRDMEQTISRRPQP